MSKSVPYFGLGRGRGRIDAGDESYEKLRKPEVVDEEKFCLENV